MKLIVGLGNPGERYEKSRHNLGFMVLDAFLRKLAPVEETIWRENKKFKSLIARVDNLILVKPQTFMNLSGFIVKKLITNYPDFIEDPSGFTESPRRSRDRLGRNQLPITDLWVVHDDLDLPLGRMKIRQGGAAGGHRGVESVIKQMGTDQFVHFRLGIGHPGPGSSDRRVEDYVLASFGAREKSTVKKTIKRGIAAIRVALEEGLERAMNRFNQ